MNHFFKFYRYERPDVKGSYNELFGLDVIEDIGREIQAQRADLDTPYPKGNYFFSKKIRSESPGEAAVYATVDLQPAGSVLTYKDITVAAGVIELWRLEFVLGQASFPNALFSVYLRDRETLRAEGYFEIAEEVTMRGSRSRIGNEMANITAFS